MKMLSAIIKPSKLQKVRDELLDVDIGRLTITEVRGYGKQKGHLEVYRGMEYNISLKPKLKLEIILDDKDLEKAITAIEKSAKTGEDGNVGDGKIFIYDIEQVVRIRTGERGKNAI